MKLIDIAYARSGDKGNDANIALIAYHEKDYLTLIEKVTEEALKKYFSHLGVKSVKRFLLPRLWAMNFILEDILEGGASLSLRLDSQGKTLGQRLLEMEIA